MADPVEIVLMPEYAAALPLWTKGGVFHIGSAAGLGLSEGLVTDLLAWSAYFETHFGRCTWPGWRPPDSAAEFARRGHQLRDRLAAELPATTITINLWSVAVTD